MLPVGVQAADNTDAGIVWYTPEITADSPAATHQDSVVYEEALAAPEAVHKNSEDQ